MVIPKLFTLDLASTIHKEHWIKTSVSKITPNTLDVTSVL